MKKFVDLDGKEFELYGEVVEYGIYYVAFNEKSEWADSNIVIGYLED